MPKLGTNGIPWKVSRKLLNFRKANHSTNSAIAWSQAQDAKGGGLCVGPATLPRKKPHATETFTLLCAT